ncbi:MAG: rhodanese-like domain-containing protein [Nitritalea sp.]
MEDIHVGALKERLENGDDFLFLDVREEWEYEEDNLGAKNIPLGTLPEVLDTLEPYKEKEIIIHCRSGARSGNAKQYLLSQGFTQVRNVLGGILAYRAL